ncbi:MAG: hypothetical protein M1507_01545 [Candidatus Thermoplasmatota archaeon]|nr:hypothetical protein [Candidatus Thermoplasmatota archaeon]
MSVYVLLLLVALSVSSLHMIAPDHWLPLTVISSAKAYSSTKKYGVAAGLGFAHAATSIVVAMAIFYAGLVLIHSYVSYLLLAGEVLLVIIGLYFIINGYRESHEETSFSETSAISVSAFPDLALLPIVISAATLSNLQIGTILLVFFLASGVALTAMVFIAGKGLGKAISKVPPKYMDYLIGGVLIATAVFIRFI